ncbi:hypothetical protein C7E20_16395 [Sphingobium sp. AEW4]|nr:hypothetical protein C7E20_16395 [Sphingobium sp. AEW4]
MPLSLWKRPKANENFMHIPWKARDAFIDWLRQIRRSAWTLIALGTALRIIIALFPGAAVLAP